MHSPNLPGKETMRTTQAIKRRLEKAGQIHLRLYRGEYGQFSAVGKEM